MKVTGRMESLMAGEESSERMEMFMKESGRKASSMGRASSKCLEVAPSKEISKEGNRMERAKKCGQKVTYT